MTMPEGILVVVVLVGALIAGGALLLMCTPSPRNMSNLRHEEMSKRLFVIGGEFDVDGEQDDDDPEETVMDCKHSGVHDTLQGDDNDEDNTTNNPDGTVAATT